MPAVNRVVVTGLGQVSSAGTDLASFANDVFSGRSRIRPLPDLEVPGLQKPIGAAVPDWNPDAWLRPKVYQNLSRTTQLAYAAAVQAFEAAKLDRIDRPRAGVYVGSGFGGQGDCEDMYRRCFTVPNARPSPSIIPMAMGNASAAFLSTEFRIKGPSLTFTVACASGTHAIGQAFRLLQTGDVDLMIAGGTDAPLKPLVLSAWNTMRVLAPANGSPHAACRPFDRQRQGMVLGEGAGFLILETLEHARARGADVLAELVGYGANSDAGHVTHPDLQGVKGCISLALADAGLDPSAIGYINAHGTATAVNDNVESHAIAETFGPEAEGVPISSTKGVHGHAMGAAGALEAIVTVLSLMEQRVPPTANYADPDPALPRLDFVSDTARPARIDDAMSNSFAFGGSNAVIVLRRA